MFLKTVYYASIVGALLLSISPFYFPCFFWHVMMVVDFWYPFIYTSPYVEKYHDYIMAKMPDVPEQPAIEVPLHLATLQTIREASKGFTVPVVIRNVLPDIPAMKLWTNKSWWIENYGDELVMCKAGNDLKYGDSVDCRLRDGLADNREDRKYITGESKIFVRRPELQAMVDSDILTAIEPGKRVFSQLFIGNPGMGSDVHAAIGVNYFRMIAGRKTWWLFPPSQTAYVYPSLNSNGFVCYTRTRVGKGTDVRSPWWNKIERYVITLNPGDILVNTAWYWHGVLNLGDDPDELVIGVPTRYVVDYSIPAFKSNPLLTTIALLSLQKNYGGRDKFASNGNNLQDGIEASRLVRKKEWKLGASEAQVGDAEVGMDSPEDHPTSLDEVRSD